ncbi:MAG: serine hydrolase family protein [Proteobacteria bacterium]|nr:serine hydrolase family protein [Pseudomonadota bacterium]
MTPVLMVPGRGNSEPEHWQSIIEARLPGLSRVQQDDWTTPSIEIWSRNIDRAVRALDQRPLLVAHSFGCLAAAHAQITLGTPVGATLFVAPADPQRFGLPQWLFAEPLAQPGVLIASDNDPWLSLKKAQMLAAEWGVRCVNLGPAGHINVASGHGIWPLGKALIESMRRQLSNAEHRPNPQPPAFLELGHGAPWRRPVVPFR